MHQQLVSSNMLNRLRHGWTHTPGWLNYFLYPISLIYMFLVNVRYWFYQIGLLQTKKLSLPVVVIGNVSVGGTGKTPLVMSLIEHLQTIGKRPGVIARGYKAELLNCPRLVEKTDTAREVGDEPLLIYQQCGVPVAVGPNRVKTGKHLILNTDCDVIISDDGFQHFALNRDINVVIVDGSRDFRVGWCLPAGLLREHPDAIKRADIVVVNGDKVNLRHRNQFSIRFKITTVQQIYGNSTDQLNRFSGKRVHAMAGIGNPERFFSQLEQSGIEIIPHVFDDHHPFRADDLKFNDSLPVLMTQKDAVKCISLIDSIPHYKKFWSVPIQVNISPDFFSFIEKKIF